MGIMRRRIRRRAIVAGAAAGGAVYAAGKRRDQAAEDEGASYQTEPRAVPATPAQPAPGGDTVTELERLAKLHQDGILTDEEFSAAKAKELGA